MNVAPRVNFTQDIKEMIAAATVLHVVRQILIGPTISTFLEEMERKLQPTYFQSTHTSSDKTTTASSTVQKLSIATEAEIFSDMDSKEMVNISRVPSFAEDTINVEDELEKEKFDIRVKDWIYECFIHLSLLLFGIYTLNEGDWYWPSRNWWEGLDKNAHYPLRWRERQYYILFGARYIESTISDRNRRNYISKLIHHLTSIILIVLSHGFYNRVGMIIMVAVDPLDILAYISCIIDEILVRDYDENKNAGNSGNTLSWRYVANTCSIAYGIVNIVVLSICVYISWSASVEPFRYNQFDDYPVGVREHILYITLYFLAGLHFKYCIDVYKYLKHKRFPKEHIFHKNK